MRSGYRRAWVTVDGNALQPQPQCLPVNGADDLRGHERIAPQHAGQRSAVQSAAPQVEGRVEFTLTIAQHVHVHAQSVARRGEAPLILARQRHERRYVECFGKVPLQRPPLPPGSLNRQHIGVTLIPWRVGDFGHDAGQSHAVLGEAVIEAYGVEHEAEVAQMAQQPDRPDRSLAGSLLDTLTHGFGKSQLRRPEIVAAAELPNVASRARPQPTALEYTI